MEEEFYASIKLVSGEEVFALVSYTDEEHDTFLILDNPVLIECIESKKGNVVGYKVKPWMSIPDDDMYIIQLDKVITLTEIKDENIIQIYKKYTGSGSQVTIDKTLGLISKVDEARVFLENIYKTK